MYFSVAANPVGQNMEGQLMLLTELFLSQLAFQPAFDQREHLLFGSDWFFCT
jgi:hypothetical protein